MAGKTIYGTVGGVVKGGGFPGCGDVAGGALSGVVIDRLVDGMAALAIHVCAGVVKVGRLPGGCIVTE